MQGNLNTHHWGKKRREGNIHFLQTHPSLTRPPVIRPRRTEFLFLEGLHEFHQVVQILLGEVARYPVLVLIAGGVVYRLHEVHCTAVMEIRSTGVDVPQRGGVKLLHQVQPYYRYIVLLTIGVVALSVYLLVEDRPGGASETVPAYPPRPYVMRLPVTKQRPGIRRVSGMAVSTPYLSVVEQLLSPLLGIRQTTVCSPEGTSCELQTPYVRYQ